MTHKDSKEWKKENFIAWMGVEYSTGCRIWNDGVADLMAHEFIVIQEGQIKVVKKTK
jgi:hypothetical protein